ncbi:MAG: hypothetical protein QF741_01935, partial [Candidatus Peribacteraceae bacterium]|nr:hypothetical protein [Candidatus Peribacteraceae bacterium]
TLSDSLEKQELQEIYENLRYLNASVGADSRERLKVMMGDLEGKMQLSRQERGGAAPVESEDTPKWFKPDTWTAKQKSTAKKALGIGALVVAGGLLAYALTSGTKKAVGAVKEKAGSFWKYIFGGAVLAVVGVGAYFGIKKALDFKEKLEMIKNFEAKLKELKDQMKNATAEQLTKLKEEYDRIKEELEAIKNGERDADAEEEEEGSGEAEEPDEGVDADEVLDTGAEALGMRFAKYRLEFQYDVASGLGLDSPSDVLTEAREIMSLSKDLKLGEIFSCINEGGDDADFIKLINKIYKSDDYFEKLSPEKKAKMLNAVMLVAGYFAKNRERLDELAEYYGKNSANELSILEVCNALSSSSVCCSQARDFVIESAKDWNITCSLPDFSNLTGNMFKQGSEFMEQQKFGCVFGSLGLPIENMESFHKNSKDVAEWCVQQGDVALETVLNSPNILPWEPEDERSKLTLAMLKHVKESQDLRQTLYGSLFINKENRSEMEQQCVDGIDEIFGSGKIHLSDAYQVFHITEGGGGSSAQMLAMKLVSIFNKHDRHDLAADRYHAFMGYITEGLLKSGLSVEGISVQFGLSEEAAIEFSNTALYLQEQAGSWLWNIITDLNACRRNNPIMFTIGAGSAAIIGGGAIHKMYKAGKATAKWTVAHTAMYKYEYYKDLINKLAIVDLDDAGDVMKFIDNNGIAKRIARQTGMSMDDATKRAVELIKSEHASANKIAKKIRALEDGKKRWWQVTKKYNEFIDRFKEKQKARQVLRNASVINGADDAVDLTKVDEFADILKQLGASEDVIKAVKGLKISENMTDILKANPKFAKAFAKHISHMDSGKAARILSKMDDAFGAIDDVAQARRLAKAMNSPRKVAKFVSAVDKCKDVTKLFRGWAKVARVLDVLGVVGDIAGFWFVWEEIGETAEEIENMSNEELKELMEGRYKYLYAELGMCGIGAGAWLVAGFGGAAASAVATPVAIATIPITAALYIAYENHKWQEDITKTDEDWMNSHEAHELIAMMRSQGFTESVRQESEAMFGGSWYNFVSAFCLPLEIYDWVSGRQTEEIKRVAQQMRDLNDEQLQALVGHTTTMTVPEQVMGEDGEPRDLKPEELESIQKKARAYVEAKVAYIKAQSNSHTHPIKSGADVRKLMENAEYFALLMANEDDLKAELERAKEADDNKTVATLEKILDNTRSDEDRAVLYREHHERQQLEVLYAQAVIQTAMGDTEEEKEKAKEMLGVMVSNQIYKRSENIILEFKVRCEEANFPWLDTTQKTELEMYMFAKFGKMVEEKSSEITELVQKRVKEQMNGEESDSAFNNLIDELEERHLEDVIVEIKDFFLGDTPERFYERLKDDTKQHAQVLKFLEKQQELATAKEELDNLVISDPQKKRKREIELMNQIMILENFFRYNNILVR